MSLKYGSFTLRILKESAYIALDLIIKNNLVYDKIMYHGNGDISLIVHSSLRDEFYKIFSENEIKCIFGKDKGIYIFISKYLKRWGALLGLIILFLSVYISSKFVWKINIEGNSSISDEEIIYLLEKSGFKLGTYIPSVNFDTVHNLFLLNSKNISWLSINLDGNIANINVKEIIKEDITSENSYANIVSRYDGQIAFISVHEGIKTVKIGDVVKEGDILISGIIDSSAEGVRFVHADGIVKAYVRKNIYIKVPMKEKVKYYTGVLHNDTKIKIFSKRINIFKKYRNLNTLYDKIETSEKLKLFGTFELPVEIFKSTYFEYDFSDVEYTKLQAEELANIQLREKMDSELQDSILISKKINHYCDFEYYYIDCELYCLENIANVVEFEVTKD